MFLYILLIYAAVKFFGFTFSKFFYTFTITFTQNYREAQRNSYRLKYACEELSASAATFYDMEQYSEGYTVFDTGQGIKVIEDQITNLLSVDGNRNPLPDSYWTGTLHYMVYFYDDSLEI